MEAVHPVTRRQAVLVVDDHPGVREALGLILDETYDVLVAEDGPAALDLLTRWRIAAVLLDLGLPGMDGFEVLARARSIAPGVPVIIVTVSDTAADAVRALKLGASDYVTKPFDEGAVLTKLADALAIPPLALPSDGDQPRAWDEAARRAAARPDSSLRPRCLVIAKHIGTAATLRLILNRYVPTNAVTDGFHAVQALGVGLPDCVVVDDPAWAADGSTFVRALRLRAPAARVALWTEAAASAAPVTAPDAGDVAQHPRLADVVGYVLRTCALTGPILVNPHLTDRIFAALDYLRLHYAETVSADGIARAAAMSRSRLAQRFRAELGTTVSHFVTTLRVEIAKLLLTDRATKLDQVAALAGFGDPSHLSRAFQAETGYRPGSYRRQLVQP